MSEPISVGDLVCVMKPCASECDCGQKVGHHFTVSRTWLFGTGWYAFGHHGGRSAAFNRLKRIPPLEELEGQPTQEDIKEPA